MVYLRVKNLSCYSHILPVCWLPPHPYIIFPFPMLFPLPLPFSPVFLFDSLYCLIYPSIYLKVVLCQWIMKKTFSLHTITFTEPLTISVLLEEKGTFGVRCCQATLTKQSLSPDDHCLVWGQFQTYILVKYFPLKDLEFCWTESLERSRSFGISRGSVTKPIHTSSSCFFRLAAATGNYLHVL